MAATLIGTTGKWGVPNDETGIIIESLDFDYQTKEKEQLNKSGEVSGLSLYGETVAVSLRGEVPVSTPFAGKTAGTLTIANDVPAHSTASLTSARCIIKNVKRSPNREDFEKIEVGGTIYPLITGS